MYKWMERALDPNSPMTEDNESVRTASSEYRGKEILYPTIRMIDGKLKKLSPEEAKQYALVNKDYKEFVSPNQASAWSKSFSNLIDSNRNENMATKTQRRNALKGHRKIEVDDEEFEFIKGKFGPGVINPKTKLRAFVKQTRNPHVGDTNVFGNEISQDTKQRNIDAVTAQSRGISSPGAGTPSVPSINNPLADQGSTTQNFAGPSSQTRLDDPVEKLQNKVMTQAGALMDREYEEYDPAQRFEGQSADTRQSFGDVRGMQGTGQQAFGEAAGVGKDVSGYAPEQVGQQSFLGGKGVGEYMSPHTANVIGGMQDNAMRTMQKQRGALQAQHQMAGAGVGSRGALENAAMMGEVQRGLGQQVAGALEGSYAQAAGMKQGDMAMEQQRQRYNQQAGLAGQDVRLRGAGQQVAATEAGRGAAAQDIDLLGRSGAAQEAYGQRDKDFAYDQFLEGRDWDKENLMLASNVLGGAPSGSTTTSSRPMSKKKDRFGRAIAGAGAGSAFGPWGAAAGGAIGFLS